MQYWAPATCVHWKTLRRPSTITSFEQGGDATDSSHGAMHSCIVCPCDSRVVHEPTRQLVLSRQARPGTPGMHLWLDVARTLADSRHPGLLFGVALAWMAAFGVTANEIRRAFGAPDGSPAPSRSVPRSLRAALWTACGSLAVLMWAWRAGHPVP